MHNLIICVPIKVLPKNPIKATIVNCSDCREPVWLSKSTPKLKNSKYVCTSCAAKYSIKESIDDIINSFA